MKKITARRGPVTVVAPLATAVIFGLIYIYGVFWRLE